MSENQYYNSTCFTFLPGGYHQFPHGAFGLTCLCTGGTATKGGHDASDEVLRLGCPEAVPVSGLLGCASQGSHMFWQVLTMEHMFSGAMWGLSENEYGNSFLLCGNSNIGMAFAVANLVPICCFWRYSVSILVPSLLATVMVLFKTNQG